MLKTNWAISILVSFILIQIFNSQISAQNIDAVLGSKDSSSAFQVMNSEGDNLFTLNSAGGVGIGAPYDPNLGNYDNKQVQFNSSSHLLFANGYRNRVPDGRNIHFMSGRDIIFDTPFHFGGFNDGARIELYSGVSGGGINILGGSHDDGYMGYGEILIQPGDGNSLNLFGGGYGATYGEKGGDVNIEGGGYSSSVNISTPRAYVPLDAGDINLTGGNSSEGRGGDIIITPGLTGIWEPDEDGQLILNGSGTYSGTWTQASDKRFKKNIQSINNPIEKIIQLEPVSYELRKKEFPDKHFEDGEQIGLIAQDVEMLFPQLVKNDKDGYKTVDYTKLSVLAIEAIKAQNERVSALEEKIENLELMLSNQKNLIEQVQYLLEKEKQNIKSTKL